MMPSKNKIDDKTKEQIRQLLAEGLAKNAVAKKVGVSWATVDKVSKEEKDSLENLREQKKEQWIEEAWKTINLYMKHVQDPKVIQRTSARDSAILIGTLHDKMLKAKELELKRQELELKKQELEQPQTSRVIIVDDIPEVEGDE
ncbi:hypothetical protein HUR95_00715 [Caldalkalibacillus thermarum TA2.A1]|uniref:Resolvase HTH domain-containing protein n=2 Tax=Caldalkalibacillus thermarum (strain TA2.A1) TaxID=986075 RepID=A0A8X8I448_CALTT|nr:hypothetical protein [Caldalkalibacillus thermarum]QZT33996.1 hypothetical protein HUR95_00715 [Caldalkalibacillus thermarum TA2.A1]